MQGTEQCYGQVDCSLHRPVHYALFLCLHIQYFMLPVLCTLGPLHSCPLCRCCSRTVFMLSLSQSHSSSPFSQSDILQNDHELKKEKEKSVESSYVSIICSLEPILFLLSFPIVSFRREVRMTIYKYININLLLPAKLS